MHGSECEVLCVSVMVIERSSEDWITLMLAALVLNLFKSFQSLYLLMFVYLFIYYITGLLLCWILAKSTDHKQIFINLMEIKCYSATV